MFLPNPTLIWEAVSPLNPTTLAPHNATTHNSKFKNLVTTIIWQKNKCENLVSPNLHKICIKLCTFDDQIVSVK